MPNDGPAELAGFALGSVPGGPRDSALFVEEVDRCTDVIVDVAIDPVVGAVTYGTLPACERRFFMTPLQFSGHRAPICRDVSVGIVGPARTAPFSNVAAVDVRRGVVMDSFA